MAYWMKEAAESIKRKGTTGAFRKQAKAAGLSTFGFAKKALKKGSTASTLTKRRANLAMRFAEARH